MAELHSIEERSKWFFERYTFEQFATDHDLHKHCIGCNGCVLDPQPVVQYSHPIWCVACRNRIEKDCAKTGKKPPWQFTMTFRRDSQSDATCEPRK